MSRFSFFINAVLVMIHLTKAPIRCAEPVPEGYLDSKEKKAKRERRKTSERQWIINRHHYVP